jgi:hypothetical protein
LDTDVDIPAGMTTLRIGNNSSGLYQINGHIAEVRYYDERLDNDTLEDMSNGIFPNLGGGSTRRVRANNAAAAASWARRMDEIAKARRMLNNKLNR